MLRARGSVCPFCIASSLPRPAIPSASVQWQQTRSYARLKKKQPSRMALSGAVRAPPKNLARDSRPAAKRSHDPFGYLNKTHAPFMPKGFKTPQASFKRDYLDELSPDDLSSVRSSGFTDRRNDSTLGSNRRMSKFENDGPDGEPFRPKSPRAFDRGDRFSRVGREESRPERFSRDNREERRPERFNHDRDDRAKRRPDRFSHDDRGERRPDGSRRFGRDERQPDRPKHSEPEELRPSRPSHDGGEERPMWSRYKEARENAAQGSRGHKQDVDNSYTEKRSQSKRGYAEENTSRRTPDRNEDRPATRSRFSSARDGRRDSRSTARTAREEPYKALKMQRALDSLPYANRGDIKKSIADIDSFSQFRLLPSIQEAVEYDILKGQNDIAPTPVQRVAIPALTAKEDRNFYRSRGDLDEGYNMKQFLIAAETGSGKTLAYLLPAIDHMKRAEDAERREDERLAAEQHRAESNWKGKNRFDVQPPPLSNIVNNVARPKVVILVPTSELVSQVGAVAKKLSHIIKFKSAPISTAYTPQVIRNRLFGANGVDIVISTPHLLSSIAEDSPNILSRVTHLVIDEADSLLDTSFSPLTSAIIEKSSPSLKALVLCSATITRKLESYVSKRFPQMQRLVTPNLHAIPRRVQMGIVNVSDDPYRGKKDVACADAIWSIGRSALEHDSTDRDAVEVKRIIVFVNEREKAVELADYLQSKGIDAEALHRDTAGRSAEILAPFRDVARQTIDKDAMPKEPAYVPPHLRNKGRKELPNTKVVVCTDLGSRGIDTLACRHVILFDVPHTSIDFIHRLGRLGRMGRRGRAIVLLGKGDRADIVKEVRDAMYTGKALI